MYFNRRVVLNFLAVISFALVASGLLLAAPNITSISPTSGSPGDQPIISGSGFGSSQGTSTVMFGSVAAQVVSWSDTSVTAVVPSSLTTSSVNVEIVVSGTPSNAVAFSVATPGIYGVLLPSTGVAGNTVLINGFNFGSPQVAAV